MSGDYITALLDDGPERIWVGTRSNGVNVCDKLSMDCVSFNTEGEGLLRLGHFHVTALFRDSRGRVWIATDGGGLHEARKEDDGTISGFFRWTEADGLLSNAIMAIVEDEDGSLWLSSRHGLTRLDPEQGRVANYVEQSGLAATHFNANAAASDSDYIYFGSTDGVLRVPRGRPFTVRPPSPVRVTAIERMGRQALHPATGWVPARLEAGYRNMLAIDFAVLDFAEVPHKYEFRTHASEPWTSLGPRTEVTFLNLAPGGYRFEARGRDVFGQWSTSDPVDIAIIPPFWMSYWFRGIGIALALLAIYTGHRVRTQRLKNRALEIERLAALREQALEHALGSKSEISGLTPRQKEVLQLIAEGCSTRDIAERLSVSIKTIETHRAHLMDRLDIHDVAGLVRLAIRARLISPHD